MYAMNRMMGVCIHTHTQIFRRQLNVEEKKKFLTTNSSSHNLLTADKRKKQVKLQENTWFNKQINKQKCCVQMEAREKEK